MSPGPETNGPPGPDDEAEAVRRVREATTEAEAAERAAEALEAEPDRSVRPAPRTGPDGDPVGGDAS